jgi:16S rRNA (adenine1518-N6/adenine1519-N6)-dimethyltransferase
VLVGFRRGELPGTDAERRATFALVDAAFGQRRKMLRQALADAMGGSAAASAVLEAAGVDPTLRGEQLAVGDFLAVVRAQER